jgi:hypothetical protein
MIARLLSAVSKIERVDADTVTAHETRIEANKVPLGCGRGQDIASIDTELAKISETSLMKAMLRSRWAFSIDFAASATLIDGAR